MSLNIGDNFKYLGKKFLDDRESFETLEELMACKTVPEGFIAFCQADGKRYEFINDEWIEFKVSSKPGDNGAGDVIINEEGAIDAVIHLGDDEPDNDNKLWLDPSNNHSSSDITMDNPIIQELFACIRTLQDQVKELQEEVEYLKINGGGGSGGGTITPPEEEYEESILALEEGGLFLFEDGSYVLLEESVEKPLSDSILILEDGMKFLMEDGSYFVLEDSIPAIIDSSVLLEDGANLLLENGGNFLIE